MSTLSDKEYICILGCGGFIGSHLCRALLDTQKYVVHGVDLSSYRITDLTENRDFVFHNQDIQDFGRIRDVIEGCSTVVNLIALCNPSMYNTRPVDVIEINFTKPYELVRLCASTGKRLIHFSTSEVYGKTLQGVAGEALKSPESEENYILKEDTSDMILGPVSSQRWSYASAKQLLERAIYAYGFEKDLDFTIIRPLNFIGPRMDYIPGIDGEGVPRVLACFMDALIFGKPIKLVDGGMNRRTFTYIDDAIEAVIRIIQRPEMCKREIFNIGHPKNECSIKELAQRMINLYKELYPEHYPEGVRVQEVSASDFYGQGYEDSDRRVPDISKAETLLGWRPVTGVDQALKLCIKDYAERYAKGIPV